LHKYIAIEFNKAIGFRNAKTQQMLKSVDCCTNVRLRNSSQIRMLNKTKDLLRHR